jgi:hypothetical protein
MKFDQDALLTPANVQKDFRQMKFTVGRIRIIMRCRGSDRGAVQRKRETSCYLTEDLHKESKKREKLNCKIPYNDGTTVSIDVKPVKPLL